jgi:hypothetical protein
MAVPAGHGRGEDQEGMVADASELAWRRALLAEACKA